MYLSHFNVVGTVKKKTYLSIFYTQKWKIPTKDKNCKLILPYLMNRAQAQISLIDSKTCFKG